MIPIFKDSGISAKGCILPRSELRLFRDLEELRADEEKIGTHTLYQIRLSASIKDGVYTFRIV